MPVIPVRFNKIGLSILLALIVFLSGCDGEKNCSDQSTCTSELLRSLSGIWLQRGYGNIIQLENARYKQYEYSSVHCLLVEEGSIKSFQDFAHYIQTNNERDHFVLKAKYTLTRFYFDKQDLLPAVCEKTSSGRVADPEKNFEAFWHTFNEQYAFFDVRNVDWNSQYGIFRNQVNQMTNDEDLFNIFSQMVAPLKDGHVNIVSPIGRFSVLNSQLYDQLNMEFEAQSEIDDFEFYKNQVFGQFKTVVDGYLLGSQKSALDGLLRWGALSDRIAYLGIDSMAGFSDTEESAVQVLVLNEALDRVMSDISNFEKIVIDLRINTGGMDEAAIAIANRFVHNARLGFTKQARFGNGYTQAQEIWLSPFEKGLFLGPIVILIGGVTSSAAENFLLAMLDRPNVITIGQRTPGIFSDVLGKQLPNGWGFSLSNEVFRAPSGESYEGIGFNPDVETDVMSQADREQGVDSALEYVLSID